MWADVGTGVAIFIGNYLMIDAFGAQPVFAICINQVPRGTESIYRLGKNMAMRSVFIKAQINFLTSAQSSGVWKLNFVYFPDGVRHAAAMMPWNDMQGDQSPISQTNLLHMY